MNFMMRAIIMCAMVAFVCTNAAAGCLIAWQLALWAWLPPHKK